MAGIAPDIRVGCMVWVLHTGGEIGRFRGKVFQRHGDASVIGVVVVNDPSNWTNYRAGEEVYVSVTTCTLD